jgi:hypothetical protein
VAAGDSRTYRLHADSEHIGSATIADFGGLDTGTRGLYGALVIAPPGAEFADPRTGLPRDVGSQVTVKVPGGRDYRDYTLAFAEDDAQIGANTMPYPVEVEGPASINYRSEPRGDDAMAFSSRAHGDPRTPLLRAYAGDPVKVHVLGAPGSEQPHVFSLGGANWKVDPRIPGSKVTPAAAVAPWTTLDVELRHGAGGEAQAVGDSWYGDLRRPFARAGMWGLMRVLAPETCDATLQPLAGRPCGEPRPQPTPRPEPEPRPETGLEPPLPPSPAAPPAPMSPAPTPPAAPKTPRRPLVTVRAPRVLELSTLRTRGLELRLDVRPGVRVLRVELAPAGTRAFRAVDARLLRVRAAGRLRFTYRPPAATSRRLRPGRYRLRVRGGPYRSVLLTTAEHRFRLR